MRAAGPTRGRGCWKLLPGEAEIVRPRRYRAEDGRSRRSQGTATPAGANAHREGPVPRFVERVLRDHPGSTVQEILERTATDMERSIKLPSIRNELQSGRKKGKYESNGRRWSLAGPGPGATETAEATPSNAPPVRARGTLGLFS